MRSSFKAVPVNIVGQSYPHRSKAFSSQLTNNLLPQKELTGASSASLISWAGAKSFHTGSGTNRGLTVFNDVLYQVNGTTLYSISSAGLRTAIGVINGSSRCIFDNDGTNLIITTGATGYQYDGTTLTTITDAQFPSSNSVTYLKQRMIYDGTGGQFVWSDVGDPDSIQSNAYATEESDPDDIVRVRAFKQNLYIFSDKTTSAWYTTTSSADPYLQIQNGVMDVGLFALHSVASTVDYLYWLGDDKRVYRASAFQPQNITSVAVSHDFDKYDVSDAIGFVCRIEGQKIYVLTSANANRTWAFNEDAGAWFNLSTGADSDRYLAEDYVECYGKRLISDKSSGNIYELDLDTYTDGGTTRIQERIFGPVRASDLGLNGDRFTMSYVVFDMEKGVGIASGQGENPQMMVACSFDGGKSWTDEQDVLLGRTGDGRIKARYDYVQSTEEVFVRLRVSDPVFICIYGASIGVKPGGY